MTTFDVSTLLVIIGALMAVVNIITEVVKKLTWDKIPSSLLAVIISLAVTLLAFFAYIQIKGIPLVWYMVVAAVVVGIMVAYAAMFGFDKLREILEKLGKGANSNDAG